MTSPGLRNGLVTLVFEQVNHDWSSEGSCPRLSIQGLQETSPGHHSIECEFSCNVFELIVKTTKSGFFQEV